MLRRSGLAIAPRFLWECLTSGAVAATTNPGATVVVSKNEEGEVFVNSTGADAFQWLSLHAAATNPGIDTPIGGAHALWDQIETGPRNTLKRAGGLRL